ncbi:MAG: hypothetical protein K2W96_26185 [Gemmataceae bacterium]|nr:hypothetical protein [Gemmataceae bacterium]
MATAELAPALARPRFRAGWIAGPWTDLPWLIGGALTGYALFALYASMPHQMDTIWLVWYVLLDIPHFFGTYLRTYLDPVERRRRPLLIYGSLAFLLVGPATILACCALFAAGSKLYLAPLAVLGAFVILWAYWHVVRQHYGIMSLYKRKNADNAPADNWLDKSLLYVGLVVPFVSLALRHPQARAIFALPDEPAPWEWIVTVGGPALVALIAAAFLARQADLLRRGEAVNLPKVLLLLAVVPLHLFVAYHPAMLATNVLFFGAFVTIFHDVQYHAIVWHAQQAKFSRPDTDRSKHGLAGWISRHFALYAVAALLMGASAWFVGCSLDIRPGCVPLVKTAEYPLFGDLTLEHLLLVTVSGMILHHYFVDGYIWRPSKDAEVRKDLKVA